MAAVVPVLLVTSEAVDDANATTVTVSSVPSVSQSSGGGKMTGKSQKKYLHDKNSEEYRKRRERNNVAVRKSRDKSRVKAQETLNKINELKVENARLEGKIQLLSKELSVLKDLFLSNAEELPDPSTTFGLFNSGASGKLKVGEPAYIATLGSKLVVANTIEVSVDGEVNQILSADGSSAIEIPVTNAIEIPASDATEIPVSDAIEMTTADATEIPSNMNTSAGLSGHRVIIGGPSA